MAQQWMPRKPNFGPPPPGYIAGLGRGATGFVTRSDLGPARVPEVQNMKSTQNEEISYADIKYDEWEGYKGALFAKNIVDEEDKQAEEAYDYCEKRVDGRHQKQRLEDEKKNQELKKEEVSLNSKFVDLKRQLSKVTFEEWESIPQCVDLSIKKRKKEKYAPVPDTIIVNLLNSGMNNNVVETEEINNQDFRDAKQILLKSKLDKMENSIEGQSKIDKFGYLTELNTKKETQFIGDVQRSRNLWKSALLADPKNPSAWLSLAQLEEENGKINDCRQVLRKAIEHCPRNQEIWIQLSRVQKPEQSQNVLLEGLRNLPSSQKLWIWAARKQNQNKEKKSKILRKGLETNPTSIRLWRQLIEMESVDEAKKLLYKAVECLPREIDLWLALAKTEDYANAKKVLNQARKSNPLNLAIWISAAKLQETQQPNDPKISQKIQKLLQKSRQILEKNGANISREEWLDEAFYAQKCKNMLTCEMLVKITLRYRLAEEEVLNAVLKDTQLFEKQRQSNQTTRFLYKYGVFTTKSKLLLDKMIEFQSRNKIHHQHQELMQALKIGTTLFGNDQSFWNITIAKFVSEQNYQTALDIISEAETKINTIQCEPILLQKVTILRLNKQTQKARSELQMLRNKYPQGRSVIESIIFEYQDQKYEEAWNLCDQYFKESKSEELWHLAFKIKRKIGSYQDSYSIIEKAVHYYPQSLVLWETFVNFQIQNNHITKARALLDKASLKINKSEELSLFSVELEVNFGDKKSAQFALSKALKLFPHSSLLWSIAIEQQPQNTRKKIANAAIQNCGDNALVSSSIAKLFWKEGSSDKIEKAKKWFEVALTKQPNNGDIWAFYLKLIEQKFSSEKDAALQKLKEVSGVFHGRVFKKVLESDIGYKMSGIEIILHLMKSVSDWLEKLAG